MARRLNLDGDGQGDLAGHGGEHRAVMVYQLDSYRYWETQLQRHDFEYGQFGENLTVDGLGDDEVCIGDRYRIGGALFEVTQPRVTCYRVGIRMNNPQMPALLVSHKRPGFYFRVIEEGEIGAGDEIVKVADGPEHVTVQEIDGLLYLPGRSPDLLQRALRIPSLSAGWKRSLEELSRPRINGGGVEMRELPRLPHHLRCGRAFARCELQRYSGRVLTYFRLFSNPGPNPITGAPSRSISGLQTRTGWDSKRILRSYSISGSPGERTYRVSVKRSTGIGSRYFHDSIREGDLLQVSAPRGNFTLAPGNKALVLLSAGIGATPVLAMLHSLADGARFNARSLVVLRHAKWNGAPIRGRSASLAQPSSAQP